jgi:hypothetical protein
MARSTDENLPSAPSFDASLDEAVGSLDADRLCPHCVHQLDGATIHRDRRLGLLHVRCTECGHVSPVVEHPTRWRWVGRVGTFMAVLAILLASLLAAGDIAATTTIAYATAWESARHFDEPLRAIGLAMDATQSWSMPPALVEQFANGTLDTAKILANPEAELAAWRTFAFMCVPLATIWGLTGALWGLLLVHRPWWIAHVWNAAILVVVILASIVVRIANSTAVVSPWQSYADAAYVIAGLRFTILAIVVGIVAKTAGTLLARPVGLLALRIFLPDRLRLAVIEFCRPVRSTRSTPGT